MHLTMMNLRLSIFSLLVLFLNFSEAQDQLGGKFTFRFDEANTSVYDESAEDYKEIETKKIRGTILINNIDGTVIIQNRNSERTFKLVGTTVEQETFRTLYQLKEQNEDFVLAEAPRYLTLIGTSERIIYTLQR